MAKADLSGNSSSRFVQSDGWSWNQSTHHIFANFDPIFFKVASWNLISACVQSERGIFNFCKVRSDIFSRSQRETLFHPASNQTFDFRTNKREAFLKRKQTIMLKRPLIVHTLSVKLNKWLLEMETRRFSRRLRGLAPEEKEFEERCFFCLYILTINSLTSSLTRYLACCRKYVHEHCQKQWDAVSNTCAHCKQPPVQEIQEEPIEDTIDEEPQRLVAR